MLTYEEALELLLDQVPPPVHLHVPLEEALDRVLAEEVRADRDLPPFDKSFVDGYAVRSEETSGVPRQITIVGTAAAGYRPVPESIGPGEAVRIMTGAPLPEGADAVQMVEKTREKDGQVEMLADVVAEENVSRRGSELCRGDLVLEQGRRLGAPEIAILATFGRTGVTVFRTPAAAILSTGDELVPAGETPAFGQIRNSNSPMLAAQCRRLGLTAREFPALPDDPALIRQALRTVLEEHDLILVTGGVSMGDYDFVHRVLKEEGIEVFFHKAAIKPGKPLILGRRGDALLFGLPGNPVSAYVTFEIFARPAIRKWIGHRGGCHSRVRARLRNDVRQKPGRLFFMPARTISGSEGLEVEGLRTRGSSDLVGFSRADSLLLVPADVTFLPAGSVVDVVLLDHWQGSES